MFTHAAKSRRKPIARKRWTVSAGFTLLELLIVVCLVLILLALTISLLAGLRSRVGETKSLANLRQLSCVMDEFKSVSRDAYPAAVQGRSYPVRSSNIRIAFDYWQIDLQWPAILHDTAPWNECHSIFFSPGLRRPSLPRDQLWIPSYSYSLSFVARPETWETGARPDRQLMAPMRGHDVTFPSSKVLMWDWEMPYLGHPQRISGSDLGERTPILFDDSHANVARPSDASPSVPNPFLKPTVREATARLHNTRSGVRGRDF